jgi:hypothetical protein
MPLVTTQSDGRAFRFGGTTDHHSVTDCRNFDTRSAFARQTFVPHRFASQPVTHTTPKRRWIELSDPSETRGLNLCQTKDPHNVPYVRHEASDTNVTTVRSLPQPTPHGRRYLTSLNVVEIALFGSGEKFLPFGLSVNINGTVGLRRLAEYDGVAVPGHPHARAPIARARLTPAQIL